MSVHPLRPSRPHSTLRLQFHRDFGFDDALAQCDYFAALGVSHLYASPIFTARSGSTHGYDVVDPQQINPELGGEAGLRRLVQGLHQRGMGLILDIVPNHMAVSAQNPWWSDVLLWGMRSRYANWFDITWHGGDAALHGKVLLPVLAAPYGALLAQGALSLQFDTESARLSIDYAGNRFPLAPEDYARILRAAISAQLAPAAAAFALVAQADNQAQREQLAQQAWQVLQQVAADEAGRDAVATALTQFVAMHDEALHHLLERQHYRLCDWRNAGDEINWRRFFEIGDLIGMRVEQDDVFDAMHRLLLQLVQQGLVDGVRIDHIDGLADPRAYARRLRERLQQARASDTSTAIPVYMVAEKILMQDEQLPGDWGLDGTSGYDFMDQVGAWLHDGGGTAALDALWQRYGAEPENFEQLVHSTRRRLLEQNFASEFDALCHSLHALARASANTRDITHMSIRRCLQELLVYFPVYRTYGDHDGCAAHDAFLIRTTAARVQPRLRHLDQATLAVVTDWFTAGHAEAASDQRQPALPADAALYWRALTRWQQLTPPLTAKASEDTAFYRYGRLLSRNEVGADPSQLALSSDAFHRKAIQRLHHYPDAMLATATHDHKRGEDARARLAVLSELPQYWWQTVQRWQEINRAAREQARLDAADELMLYQTLVGVWPLTQCDLPSLHPRLAAWQIKALREAKRRSDWTNPDLAYEAVCADFLTRILQPEQDFLPALQEFVVRVASAGALNSLSQTMLHLTTPGVPDLYQGCDLWDFSLVDPDNRRAVDFAAHQELMQQWSTRALTLQDWRSGACKQQLIRMLLHFRSNHTTLFSRGDYLPLTVQGALSPRLIAFARSIDTQMIVVLCSRHAAGLLDSASAVPLIAPQHWGDTRVILPLRQGQPVRQWQSVLSGRQGATGMVEGRHRSLPVGVVLDSFPVDLLVLSS